MFYIKTAFVKEVVTMAHIQRFVQNNQFTLKKTISYYVMHISVAMFVGYIVTGSLMLALTLSLLEPTVQAIAFFFHEKVWNQKQQNLQEDTLNGDLNTELNPS